MQARLKRHPHGLRRLPTEVKAQPRRLISLPAVKLTRNEEPTDGSVPSNLSRTEKLAALGQLVSSVVHDLQNPLTGISGYAHRFLQRTSPPTRAELCRLASEADRALQIVQNLLEYGRGRGPSVGPVSLNKVIRRVLALRDRELRRRRILVDARLAADSPVVRGDAHQLEQVVLNLLINAEQALETVSLESRVSRPRGIVISTKKTLGERVVLEISDNGPGVLPTIAARIFDPFFTTKPTGIGTGLGLTVVQGVVKDHGGEVFFRPRRRGGATFVVELPGSPPTTAIAQRPGKKFGPLHRNGNSAALEKPRRILVVEDEPSVAAIVRDILEEEGHAVETVSDGRAALRRISAAKNGNNFELILCDLRMPRLDGPAVYAALERAGHPARHRMLFITGDSLGVRARDFLNRKALPFLSKPFQVDELINAIRRQLAATKAPQLDTTGDQS